MKLFEAIDQGAVSAFHFIRNLPALHPVLIALAYVGDHLVLLVVLLLGLIVLQMQRATRVAWLVAGTTLVAALLTFAAKALVDRDWANVEWTPLQPSPWEMKSFPSGYALLSTVVYGSLGILLARRTTSSRKRLVLRTLAFVLPLLAGAGRLFIGHNFLSDVLAGWAVGALLVMICADLDRRALVTGGVP